MKILKVISLLLDYPTAQLREHQLELAMAITSAHEISPEQRAELRALLGEPCSTAAAPCHCCCSSTCTASPATAARPWST